jgi:hypothetical protein
MNMMIRAAFLIGLMATAGGLIAPAASAQIFTPTYQAPASSSDIGIYLSDGPGEFALEGIMRRAFGGYDLGFRAGVADTDGASLLLGIDFRNPLSLGTAPLDLAFTAGAQGLLGGPSGFGAQAGLSVGHTFVPEGGGFTFTPYLHPRLAMVDSPSDALDDFSLELLADVGADFGFTSGLVLRLGVTIGDIPGSGDGWGVGLVWR